MKRGKKICETLKAIRREIAVANEIDYSPTECHHEGDCAGTCPKCESETRWLEKQLRNRQALGKAVAIAGLSLALGAMASCHHKTSKSHSVGSSDESEESLECSTESGDITAGVVDESFFKSTSKDGDTIHNFTPLKGDDNVSKKGDNDEDDEKYQVMGEVAVDENGNTYGPE
ncbi:MAG: hypothetical protein IKW83_01320 [Muribaculaceae bacterium]|nr:hypothetical protein [Muribaculaceae bacterium]